MSLNNHSQGQDKLPKIPILFDDPNDQMLTHMRRRFSGFGRYDLHNMRNYPVTTDYELLLHYLRGVAGPFIDWITLMDVGCGFELVPKGFESDDDGHEAKKVVENQFEKMELEETMQRYSVFGEVLGRKAIVRTYNENGMFYYNEYERCTGIDAINPLSLDMKRVEQVNYDRTGTIEFVQQAPSKLGSPNIKISQDRMDYSTRGTLFRYGVYGHSALANCLTDLRTVAEAPELRLKLMRKQAQVYMHILMDVQELLKTPMGPEVLKDWKKAETALQDSIDLIKKQEKHGNTFVSYSFLKPATVTSASGKTTDFSGTERSTYEVIAMKTGVPIQLLNMNAKDVNRATLEPIIDTFVRTREASGSRKHYQKKIAGYAQEIKNQAGIVEGYFQVKFKPFLQKDLVALLERMNLLWNMGAASQTEIRRSQDMPDTIDYGVEGESADYQEPPKGTITNPNPQLEPPKNNVQKKQQMIELKKNLRTLNLLN